MAAEQIHAFTLGERRRVPSAILYRPDGTREDLTSKTVTFSMFNASTGAAKVDNQPAVVVGPATDGQVRYDWQAADVDTAGDFWCYFTVLEGGQPETFPPGRMAKIRLAAKA